MPEKLYSCLRFFVLLIITILPALQSYGSHIFGVDLYYTHVSGNTYTINLVIYGDCAGSAFPSLPNATPEIDIYNGDSYISDVILSIQTPFAGVEVTPVCPADKNNTTCSNLASTIPGITKFVYSGNVTLSGPSSVWRFLFLGSMGTGTSAGRSNNITNIVVSAFTGSVVQLVDTLNNTVFDNSNAVFNTIPTPFFCINVPANFNPAAVDPNPGDSLVFSLVPGINANTGTRVSYIAPYTATAPLATVPGAFSFSNATGQLSFTPNLVQRALVVYNVEQYNAGVLRGTSQREMTVVVLSPCSNNPPTGTISTPTAGTAIDSTQFNICNSAGPFSFHINPTDADGDTITMTVSGLPAGATLNIANNSTPAPLGTFTWSTTGIAPGNYIFFITYQDNGCPLSSTQTLAYTITVLPAPTETYAMVSAATCTKKGVFQVTPGGSFSPYTIHIIEGVSQVQTFSNITAVLTDSLLSGTYTIYTYNPDNCFVDTTITIASPTLPTAMVATTPVLCPGGGATGTATITGSLGVAPYQYAIGAGAFSSSGTFTGLAPGTFTFYVKDANGCVNETVAAIPDATPILMHLGIHKPLCNNFADGTVIIDAYNSIEPYTYATGTGGYSGNDTFTSLAAGTYTFEVKNANNCIVDTTITLIDSEKIQATLSIANLCYGTDATVTVNANGGFGPRYTYAFNSGSFDSTDLFTLPAGSYVIHVLDPNSCFFDTSLTLTQPPAITITPVLTNISCNGGANGSVLVNATGGTPTYQYSINGGTLDTSSLFGGLVAGSQTIKVEDANGCIYKDTVTLTQPSPVIINSVISQMPTCNAGASGTFTVTSSGGTPGYTYAYNTAAYTASDVLTGLSAGVYTVDVKDANSCIKDTVLTLSQPIISSALIIGSNTPLCADSTLYLTAFDAIPGVSYDWSGPNRYVSNLQNPTIIDASTAASGIYTVIASLGICRDTATKAVQVNPTPPLPVLGSNAPICSGGVLNLNVIPTAGTTYSWTGPNGFTSSAQNITINAVTTAATGLYSVIGTIGVCSSILAQQTVLVDSTPVRPVATSNSPICQYDSLTLTSATATAGVTYSWTGPLSFTSVNENPVIYNADTLVSGAYQVTVRQGICTSSAVVSVTVNPTPVIKSINSNSPVCSGGTLQLSTTFTDELFGTFNWTGPNGFTAAVQDPDIALITTLSSGVYSVSETLAGCTSAISTIPVVIDSTPQAPDVWNNSPICQRNTLQLYAADSTPGVTYGWTGPLSFTSVNENPVIYNADTLVSGAYQVTVRLGICTSSAVIHATVNPIPVMQSISSNSPVCSGSTLQLSTTFTDGLFGTFNWTGPNGFAIAGVQDPSIALITTLSSGVYSVSETLAGCTSAISAIAVVIDSTPQVPAVWNNLPVCQGDTLQLYAADSTSGVTYSWTGPNGFTSVLRDPSITNVSLAAAGPYQVIAILGKCVDSSTTAVSITPTPPFTPTSNTPVCSGDTLFLQANGVAGSFYIWSGPYAYYSYSHASAPFIANAQPENAGVYTVTALLNGCKTSETTTVVVNQIPAPPSVSWPTYCQYYPAPPLMANDMNITWYPSNTIANGSTIPLVPSTAIVGSTFYYATQTVDGCISPMDSIQVTVNPKPVVTLGPADTLVCPNSSFALTAIDADPIAYYHWYPGIYLGSTTTASVTVSPETNVSYMVVAGNQFGCMDTAGINVTVYPAALVKLPDSVTLYPGETYTMSPETNGASFKWVPAAGLSSATIPDPVASPVVNTKYIVYAQTDNGCIASDSINIYLSPNSLFAVPNAFTPGREPNSEFKLIKKGIVTLDYFRIFNRWGQKIFETNDIDQGWDGTFKGTPQPFDVYVYEVEAVSSTGQNFVMQGNITLIR